MKVLKGDKELANDERLLDAVKLCNRSSGGGKPNPTHGEGPLIKGDKRQDSIKSLQRILLALGEDLGETGPDKDGVDGEFGGKTFAAVQNFQDEESHKDWELKSLEEDEKVGPRTSDALNREVVGQMSGIDFYKTESELIQKTSKREIVTMTSNLIQEDSGIVLDELKGGNRVVLVVKGELGTALSILFVDENGNSLPNTEYVLEGPNDFKRVGHTDDEGKLKEANLPAADSFELQVGSGQADTDELPPEPESDDEDVESADEEAEA